MKVAVMGATGLLGKALMREWKEDEVLGFGSRDVDIRDSAAVAKLMAKARPDWVVLAAAYTDVDGCESNRELAFAVNRDGAANVAHATKAARAKLLFISSDYVFDGTRRVPYETNSPRHPLGVYGQSKAEAEVLLTDILPDCCILRSSWIFGVDGKCFPDTILKLTETKPQIDVVNDQRGSPTYTVDLARAIIRLCHADARGIVHATNAGDCTWYEFAKEIVARVGAGTSVRPTTSDRMARPAPRPAYSVLSLESLKQWGITMPIWQDALQRYLGERSVQRGVA